MAIDCSKIKTGFAREDCANPAIPGTGPRIILISYTDIDRSKSNMANGVLSTIVLKKGAQGYEVDSLPDATVGELSLNAGTYSNTLGHSVTIRIFDKTEAAKKFGNGLVNSKVIAIVENNEHAADGSVKYEVYGWESGLKLSALTSTTAMDDNVAYLYTLSTPSNGREGMLPLSLFNTDEETTDAAVEALLTPAA